MAGHNAKNVRSENPNIIDKFLEIFRNPNSLYFNIDTNPKNGIKNKPELFVNIASPKNIPDNIKFFFDDLLIKDNEKYKKDMNMNNDNKTSV